MAKEVNRAYFENLLLKIDVIVEEVTKYKFNNDNANLISNTNNLAGYSSVLKELLAENVDIEIKKGEEEDEQ